MEKVVIIVDNRERNLDVLDSLSKMDILLRFSQLPVGDYIISDRICVERKTSSDFERSIVDGRLFEQMERLSSSFQKPFLIVEGNLGERINKNATFGAMLRIYIDYSVQVIKTEDAYETAFMLSRIAEMEQRVENREPRLHGYKKAFTNEQWQILVLSSMPMIGPKLARDMIKHFKTIRNIATADVEELRKVEKIGKKKAERIYKILNSEFGIDGE